MKKRWWSMMTVLVLLLGLFPAARAEGATSFSFDTAAKASLANMTLSTDYLLKHSASGKWNAKEGDFELKLSDAGIETDWTGYRYMNFWVYNPKANNAKINVYFYTTTESEEPYFLEFQRLNWTGWRRLVYRLDCLYTPDRSNSYASVDKIVLNLGGIQNGQYDDPSVVTEPLYVDSLWLSNEPAEQPQYGTLVSLDTSQTIAEKSDLYVNGKPTSYLTPVEEPQYINNYSGAWLDPKANNSVEFPYESVISFMPYAYLNMWIYSEKATGDTMTVAALSEKELNGGWNYHYANVTIDWVGWKNVQLHLSNDFKTGSGTPNWKAGYKLLYSFGWGGSDYSAENRLYIDKIFASFSTEMPDISLTETSPLNGRGDVSPAEAMVSFTFAGELAPKNNYTELFTVKKTKNCVEEPENNIFAAAEGNVLTLYFTKGAQPETTYDITLNGQVIGRYGQQQTVEQTVSFTTRAERLEAAEFGFTDMFGTPLTQKPGPDEMIFLYGVITNQSAKQREIKAIVAEYDESGAIIDITIIPVDVAPYTENYELNEYISMGDFSGKKRAFLFESMDSLQPLAKAASIQ